MTNSFEWQALPRFPFGDGPVLADELLALILAGRKRATCWSAAEGEGDLSLSYWREAHRDYFTKNGGFTPEMLLWCERFELF